jgi:hypothetical protein
MSGEMVEIARRLNPTIETVLRTHNEDEAKLLKKDDVGTAFVESMNSRPGRRGISCSEWASTTPRLTSHSTRSVDDGLLPGKRKDHFANGRVLWQLSHPDTSRGRQRVGNIQAAVDRREPDLALHGPFGICNPRAHPSTVEQGMFLPWTEKPLRWYWLPPRFGSSLTYLS